MGERKASEHTGLPSQAMRMRVGTIDLCEAGRSVKQGVRLLSGAVC